MDITLCSTNQKEVSRHEFIQLRNLLKATIYSFSVYHLLLCSSRVQLQGKPSKNSDAIQWLHLPLYKYRISQQHSITSQLVEVKPFEMHKRLINIAQIHFNERTEKIMVQQSFRVFKRSCTNFLSSRQILKWILNKQAQVHYGTDMQKNIQPWFIAKLQRAHKKTHSTQVWNYF